MGWVVSSVLRCVLLFLCRPARCGRWCVQRARWSSVVAQFLHVFGHYVKGDSDEALGTNPCHWKTNKIDIALYCQNSLNIDQQASGTPLEGLKHQDAPSFGVLMMASLKSPMHVQWVEIWWMKAWFWFASDSHHFHSHQTIQWALMPYCQGLCHPGRENTPVRIEMCHHILKFIT